VLVGAPHLTVRPFGLEDVSLGQGVFADKRKLLPPGEGIVWRGAVPWVLLHGAATLGVVTLSKSRMLYG
jgi:hypothetical protein